jgi:hypothetical protein
MAFRAHIAERHRWAIAEPALKKATAALDGG